MVYFISIISFIYLIFALLIVREICEAQDEE